MKIDEKKVVEVIGRLMGRALHHKNAAEQTPDLKKSKAHMSAYEDLMSLAHDLSNATDNPDYARSREAYNWSVKN